jgi:hypothetical protein
MIIRCPKVKHCAIDEDLNEFSPLEKSFCQCARETRVDGFQTRRATDASEAKIDRLLCCLLHQTKRKNPRSYKNASFLPFLLKVCPLHRFIISHDGSREHPRHQSAIK